ncbi:MAG: NADH-quinone oxidoreductase subunit C [Bacteroidota bacterium]
MNTAIIKNNTCIPVANIPVMEYEVFAEVVTHLLADKNNHCVAYYGYRLDAENLKFICAIAKDNRGDIVMLSYELDTTQTTRIDSICPGSLTLQMYEREIAENFGIEFFGHPWAKPVRYAWNRADKDKVLQNYPFYRIDGNQLHEVGVGPIHAGVIEPGHFRFLCHGEEVLHLEIQLGYQHRGVENLYLTKKSLLQRTVLSESIAGDTVSGHALAFCGVTESLAGFEPDEQLSLLRGLSLELERIAVHVGDLSAFCTDVAYQLGAAVFGALRTPMINYGQLWCGNRFNKGLIRPGYNPWAYTIELRDKLNSVLDDFEMKYREMADEMFSLDTVQSRYEKTGDVTREQMEMIGAVGMAARITGIPRDIRASHPFGSYKTLKYIPELQQGGDVWARGMLRHDEILSSIKYVRDLLDKLDLSSEVVRAVQPRVHKLEFKPNMFSISLTEGWRGEICHSAITDENGEIIHYKVKDPSFHNWLALALAVRNQEISDFPICNKSYDLSYCGFDL